MSLQEAVQTSVDALRDGRGPEAVDEALVSLLLALAREMDGARAVSSQADRALRTARQEFPEDAALHEQIALLRARLSERTALDRLSARLLAGLDALGATPKVRGTAKGAPTPGPLGQLGQMRALRGGKG